MASLSSLPFSIERAAEGYGPVRFRILATIQQGRVSDSVSFRSGSARTRNHDPGACVFGGERSVRVFRGCSRRIVRLRTGSRDPVEGEEEKRLEETIEKSKRDLAVQKELFQQIAERRRLITSIETGTINSVGERDSSQENENTPVLDGAYITPSSLDQYSNTSFSISSVESERQPFESSLPEGVEANRDTSEAEAYAIPKFPFDNSTAALSASSVEHEGQSFGSSQPETIKENVDSSEAEAKTILSSSLQNSTAAFSSSTVEQERQTFGGSLTERGEEKMDLTENEDISRSSAKIDGHYIYSEEDQAKASSCDESLFDLDSPVKTAETITLPNLLPMTSETSDPKVELEEWTVNNFPSNTDEPTPNDTKPVPLAGANVMNVILVAAECSPFSKTGGLGDVAGSLPKALARRGHRVMDVYNEIELICPFTSLNKFLLWLEVYEVVVPKYGDYPEAQNVGVLKRYKAAGQDLEVNYYHAYIDGVDFVFIDSPVFRHIHGDIYGGNRLDIWKRNVLFCKVAVEVPWHVPCGGVCYGDGNLVFIANDWHTALLPVYLKAYYRDNGSMIYTRSVLVIHNIAHQGRGPLADFPILDLPEHYVENFRVYDPVGGEHCNIFAAGLKAADRIVTVSHGYAWELKTQEGGWGLHNIIAENDWKFRGIVNGIDPNEWNPKVDSYLQSDGYTNYTLETLHTGKPQCKAALQRELGLPERADVPLIGFIGRLDGQKGVDIIADAVPWMMGQDVQLVMLGSGRNDLEQRLKQLEGQYYDKARGWVGFSVQMAHRITAGADILLMPSRFEPCGLNQLYAMNYGTIPVVHAVGGLRDTVLPFDPFNETGYGWTFDRAETVKLIDALGNCLMTYRQHKKSWEGLQRRGMAQDLSWDHAAEMYEEVLVAAKYQW